MNTPFALATTVVLLAGNAFFVGAEFAVTSSRRSQLEPLAGAGDARAATALWALEHISRMLATAQLGVTVCSTGLGVVAEPAIARAVSPLLEDIGLGRAGAHAVAVVAALVLVVYIHVVAGEMVPKNMSIAAPERAVRLLAPPLVRLSRLFGPVITALNGFANWVLHLAGLETREEVSATFNAAEVASIVERSTAEGVLEDDTGLLSGALEFSEETAGGVMVPLDALVTLSEGCTPEDVERAVAATGFSRGPGGGRRRQRPGRPLAHPRHRLSSSQGCPVRHRSPAKRSGTGLARPRARAGARRRRGRGRAGGDAAHRRPPGACRGFRGRHPRRRLPRGHPRGAGRGGQRRHAARVSRPDRSQCAVVCQAPPDGAHRRVLKCRGGCEPAADDTASAP